eukprot:gene29265-38335_t
MSKIKRSKRPSKKPTKQQQFTADDYIDKANQALADIQLESASIFYSKALSLRPDDCNIMDALADVKLQLGEPTEAMDLLLQSTAMAPTDNPFKWMFLAQLQKGQEALISYKAGIDILAATLSSSDGEEQGQEAVSSVKTQIAKAHCAIAELFLTDLCFDDGAEEQCERSIAAAWAVDPRSLDAAQALASLRLSQGRATDACRAMDSVAERILAARKVYRERTLMDELRGKEEPQEITEMPEMEFLISSAKLLIECAATEAVFAEHAADLLLDLLQDDDENIELWYLSGVASMMRHPRDPGSARHHLERARDMIRDLQQQYQLQQEQEQEQEDEEQGEKGEGGSLELDGMESATVLPFADELRLVADHLQLLDAEDRVRSTDTHNSLIKASSSNVADSLEVDEEWSDDDAGEENLSAREKSGQDAMDECS